MNIVASDLPPAEDQAVKRAVWVRPLKASAAVVACLGCWIYALSLSSRALAFQQWELAAWSAGFLVLSVPLFALAATVLDVRIYLPLIVVASLGYLLFFPFSPYALLAVAVLLFGYWRVWRRTDFELSNNVRFAPQHIVSRVSRILLLAVTLVAALNIYEATARNLSADPENFYRQLSLAVTPGVLPLVEKELAGFEPGQTLDQFIVKGFVDSQPGFAALPESVRTEQVAIARQGILERLGIEAQGSEPLADIAEKAVEFQLKNLLGPFSVYLPLLYGLAVFYLLRVVSVFLDWLAKLWGHLLFWFLRRIGYLRITSVQIQAERVEI